jgi:glycosyltransferase involved in cell wall biosynthesis
MSKNTFFVSCPIDTYSGYGARSRDFVKALIELNEYEVRILPQRWGMTPFGFIEDHIEEWGFLKNHIVPQLTEQPDIWCQITVPNEFQPIGKYNIGLTAGIETTVCAPQWIEGCNRMNLILTSSTHSQTIFKNTNYQINNKQTNQIQGELKLDKPIEVLIEGANLEIYKPLEVKEFTSKNLIKDLDSIKESFAYLFVGHWMQGDLGEDRKNVGLLVKAFYEIFKNKSKMPALILKTSIVGASYMDRREIQNRIDAIRKSVPGGKLPSIYLLHGEFTDKEMNELYNHSKIKAMVSLTKGEGFGRPLLEFSLTNKPIIASGWSGHLDFLNPEFTALLGGKLTQIHPSAQVKDMLIENSQWFSADHGHIGHFMNDVFENYKEWQVKGKRQGFYSRTNFSFEKMKEQLKDILTKNLPELPKQVKLKLPKLNKIELPKKIEING